MAHQLYCLVRSEHLGLLVKFRLVLGIVNFGVYRRHHEDGRFPHQKGQGFRNAGRLSSQSVGGKLIQSGKLPLILAATFLMGAIITIAEPDLQVLANQVASIPNQVLIWTVAVGVGVFLAVAALRIRFHIPLAGLLGILYLALFLLSFLAPAEFTAVAFDSGGVTTGPMTVPFIMAVGVGLSAAKGGREGADDSFGLVALCSVGPILMVLLPGIFYNPTDAAYTPLEVTPVVTSYDVVVQFLQALPHYAKEVLLCLLPVVGVFLLFQLITRTYRQRQLLRMGVGFGYTIIGLILFLTGVNVGFAPVGNLFGAGLAGGFSVHTTSRRTFPAAAGRRRGDRQEERLR